MDSKTWSPDVVKDASTFVPPKGVQAEAKRALEWIKEGHAGDGFTDVGRKRASDLAAGRAVSLDTIKRMNSFLARHSVDKQGQGWSPGEDGYPSPGRVAYAAWGGEPAKSWVRSILDRADDKKVVKYSSDQERDDHGRFAGGGHVGSSGEKLPSYSDLQHMTEIAGPQGGMGGQWYRDSNGQEYFVKPALSAHHAMNEIAAGAVYHAAGLPFPNTGMLEHDGKSYIISEKIDGLDRKTISDWSHDPELQAKAAEGFGVDALLSHWDVHGLNADNTLINAEGEPVRIESGGAMSYRAMGGDKATFSPTSDWVEPVSMRTSDQGLPMYGNTTDEQIASSLERAAKINLDDVSARWEAMGIPSIVSAGWKQTLEARQAQIPSLVESLRSFGKMFKPIASVWSPTIQKYDPSQPRQAGGRFGEVAHVDKQVSDLKVGDVISTDGKSHMHITSIEHKGDNVYSLTVTSKSQESPVTFQTTGDTTYKVTESKAQAESEKQPGQAPQFAGAKAFDEVGLKPLSEFRQGEIIESAKHGKIMISSMMGPNDANMYILEGVDRNGGVHKFALNGDKERMEMQVSTKVIDLNSPEHSIRAFLDQVHSGPITAGALKIGDINGIPLMTKEERDAVSYYTGSGSGPINHALRQGQTNTQTELVRSAIERTQTQSTITLHRGSGEASLHVNGSAYGTHISRSELEPGVVLRDQGFRSTSIADPFSGEVRYHLTVPEGVPASWVHPISNHKTEHEVLLGAGLALVVTDVRHSGGTSHVFATVIPPALDESLIGGSQSGSAVGRIPADELSGFKPRYHKMIESPA